MAKISLPTKQKITDILDTLSSIAILVVAGVLLWTYFSSDSGQRAPPPIEELHNSVIIPQKHWPAQGAGEVVVVEVVDFECPFCRSHAQDVFPELHKDLISSSKIKYFSLQFPLEQIHPLAMTAAIAAECAGEQGMYWEMHDKLFSGSTALTTSMIDEYVAALDLDNNAFNTCTKDDNAQNNIAEYRDILTELGIQATPTFLFGRILPDGSISLQYKLAGINEGATFHDLINRVGSTF